MNFVRTIYDRLFLDYRVSLKDARDSEDKINPAENSVIYRYFLDRKRKELGRGKRKTAMEMLIEAGRTEEKADYLRRILTYMCEDPLRYREGHVYKSESEPGEKEEEKRIYLLGLRPLLRAAGSSLAGKQEAKVAEVRRELEALRDDLDQNQKRAKQIADGIPAAEWESLTEYLFRTALHETIKVFFRDMGYSFSEEVHRADLHSRKVNKVLDLLEYCGSEMNVTIAFGEEAGNRIDLQPEACNLLLDILNRAGEDENYDGGFVPLIISPYGHMLCILGRDYYRCMFSETDFREHSGKIARSDKKKRYAFGVVGPVLDPKDWGSEYSGLQYEIWGDSQTDFSSGMDFANAESRFRSWTGRAKDVFIEWNEALAIRVDKMGQLGFLGTFFGFDTSGADEAEGQYRASREELLQREEAYVREAMR